LICRPRAQAPPPRQGPHAWKGKNPRRKRRSPPGVRMPNMLNLWHCLTKSTVRLQRRASPQCAWHALLAESWLGLSGI
jgi:hypothetical protein